MLSSCRVIADPKIYSSFRFFVGRTPSRSIFPIQPLSVKPLRSISPVKPHWLAPQVCDARKDSDFSAINPRLFTEIKIFFRGAANICHK